MNTGCIQENIHAFTNFPSISYTLEKGERLVLYAVISQGWSERKTLHILLNDEYASCDVVLFFLGKNHETFPCDISIKSHAKATYVSVVVRSLLTGSSSIDMNGRCTLAPGSEKSELFFTSHSLLLSNSAQARIIPSLEVEVDDVKAAHAATLGKFDEEKMFFLQSRGFTQKQATQLIAQNFFASHIPKIPEQYKETITKPLDEFLKKISISV